MASPPRPKAQSQRPGVDSYHEVSRERPAGQASPPETDLAVPIEIDLEPLSDPPEGDPPRMLELPAICPFGRFEVLGRIAFGGMAEIFLARERGEGGASRHVVIKRILPHVADDERFVEMFLDEARLAIQLNHPHICHIYEFGKLEGSYFIAMEWVNGMPLGKVLRQARKHGGVPPEVGVRIVSQVAEALHYAHRARDGSGRSLGIVHRDVTPHNVMVSYDGVVKLLDFGIAKARSQMTKTRAGVVKGKFSYMAPEQCLGVKVDSRADLFGLGVCLYETLTGRALYRRESEYETMRAVVEDPVPSVRTVRPDLPAELDAIVQKALAKKAEDRYQTGGELHAALEQWLARSGRFVTTSGVSEFMERLFADQIKRGPLVDSTPFGESFRRYPVEGADGVLRASGSNPSASVPLGTGLSDAELRVLAGKRRGGGGRTLLIAAVVLVIGLGGGAFLATKLAPTYLAGPAEQATPAAAPVPMPVPVPVPDPVPEPAATLAPPPVPEPPAPPPPAEDPESADAAEIAAAATERARPAEPRATGLLSINTRPWSKVYVGPRLLGTTPIGEARVPAGAVRLRLVDRDGEIHTKSVRVAPNGTARVFFDLADTPAPAPP